MFDGHDCLLASLIQPTLHAQVDQKVILRGQEWGSQTLCSSAWCLQNSLAQGWCMGPSLVEAHAVVLCSRLRSLKGWLAEAWAKAGSKQLWVD